MMNAEQKQQAQQAIEGWQSVRNDDPMKPAGDVLAALLQDLVDAPAPIVPEGMKLLPKVATPEMLDGLIGAGCCKSLEKAYAALYAAAPTPAEAPEPEPAARVTGYYAGYLSIATVDGRVLPAGTALYAAPPAPSVPDGWRIVPYTPTVQMLERAAYAVNNRPQPSKYEPSATPAIIFWTAMLNYAPEAVFINSCSKPPKLSDERIKELSDIHMNMYGFDDVAFARAIEREILGGEA